MYDLIENFKNKTVIIKPKELHLTPKNLKPKNNNKL